MAAVFHWAMQESILNAITGCNTAIGGVPCTATLGYSNGTRLKLLNANGLVKWVFVEAGGGTQTMDFVPVFNMAANGEATLSAGFAANGSWLNLLPADNTPLASYLFEVMAWGAWDLGVSGPVATTAGPGVMVLTALTGAPVVTGLTLGFPASLGSASMNVALRNKVLDGITAPNGSANAGGGHLRLFAGAVPADADAAETGTLVVDIDLGPPSGYSTIFQIGGGATGPKVFFTTSVFGAAVAAGPITYGRIQTVFGEVFQFAAADIASINTLTPTVGQNVIVSNIDVEVAH